MNTIDLSNRLVVVTGVGRAGQVGEALALGLAQRGATLALIDLQTAEAEARAATLTAMGYPATGHAANLADTTDAARVASEVMAQTGARFANAVHAVVCVAGGFGMTGALDSSDVEAWHKQFTINLDTAYSTTRAFLGAVRAGKGSFVYFASAAALPGGNPRGLAAYTSAKSGVLALMRAVAADERANEVRANAVAPSQIRTAANESSMGADKDYVERESVADVVAFLVSTMARNITGQVITLA